MSEPAPQRTDEEWRRFVAEHLEKQTSALQSMRGMMIFFTVVTALGLLFWVAALFG